MSRALVIGGSGFLGAAIATALEREGLEVVCLSRSGSARAGRGVAGDVRLPDLGLDRSASAGVRDGLTHVVSCFGSVDWSSGPRLAELHLEGTRNALRFAAACPRLERLVHVSSVLALGRARGVQDNTRLDVGQRFRTWYEFAKFVAEREVRGAESVPRRVVRFGPILGVGDDGAPSAEFGLTAAVPLLLRGYPVHLAGRGRFPCYVGEVTAAGRVAARAALDEGSPATWTWYDARRPTLASVLTAVCSAWGVVPRIVDLRAWGRASRLLAGPLGAPEPLLQYAEPWAEIDPAVLDELPSDLPACPAAYLEATGAALRARTGELMAA